MSKKAINIKDNIGLTVYDNKLAVLNTVTYDLVEDDADIEDSFFAPVDNKEEVKHKYLYIVCDTNGYGFIDSNDKKAKWIIDGSDKLNIDSYPEEMQEMINKGINQTKKIKNFTDEEITANTYSEIGEEAYKKSEELTKKAYEDLEKQIKKFRATSGEVNLIDMLDRYTFKKHLLIMGEKGNGKTYAVDKMAKDKGITTIETAGHEGIESVDLLGYYVKDEKGNLVWMDGVLTEAFRKAQHEQVILFFDELLRIPARELNILVGALTPMSDKTFTLRTNRVVNSKDGIAESEIIKIDMSNLWVVGTTNVGAGYNVDEIDNALADRFRIVHKTSSITELEHILTSCASVSGIDNKIISQLLEFYTKMRDLVSSGELEKFVNTRHLCEVLSLSKDIDDVKMYMYDLIPTWTSMDTDGRPNKAESDIIGKLIKRIIKG